MASSFYDGGFFKRENGSSINMERYYGVCAPILSFMNLPILFYFFYRFAIGITSD